MSRLRRYTVTKNKKGSGWVLKDDKSKRVKHTFRTKANAKKGGVIKGMLGPEGGTVRFQNEHVDSMKNAPSQDAAIHRPPRDKRRRPPPGN